MQWDDEGTSVVFCSHHTLEYFDWDGTDKDFVKMIATPKINYKGRDRIALIETQ